MPGPNTDPQICPNQPYGEHITVRCSGCNSIHSTKNIGWRNEETKKVSLARSLFDILGTFCVCDNPSEYPLIHDCEIDDNIDYRYVGLDDGKFHLDPTREHKHIAKTPIARAVLQLWWNRFAQTKEMRVPTQEELDSLVLLEE